MFANIEAQRQCKKMENNSASPKQWRPGAN